MIRLTADALASNGMAALGHTYLVVDDRWFTPNRDAAGNVQANPSRYPGGMKALGDCLHSKGPKFGIYAAPPDKTRARYFSTCPGATGCRGHEAQDARQFAAWGLDHFTYDARPGGFNDRDMLEVGRPG